MSNSREDRYYGGAGKARKTPPGGDSQSLFQTGQVPVAYPNQYSPQRSTAQGRSDHITSYGQWSPNTASLVPQQPTSFPVYEHQDTRYPAQPTYTPYPARTPPPIPTDPHSSRTLPPLNLSPASRGDRWQAPPSYPQNVTQVSNAGNIRSPTASYPASFLPYPQPHQSSSYSFPPVPDPRGHPPFASSMHSHPQPMHMGSLPPVERITLSRTEAHSNSPYARTPAMVPAYPPQQEAPVPEEPSIKKKRKRADAAQLKVLNDTYARTAFPSTEERAELARKLDMSARSVQIWFQNKRQSMRQTSRQTSTVVPSGSHQPFSIPPQSEDISHASMSSYGAGSSSMSPNMSGSSYAPRPSPDSSRSAISHSSQTPPPHRRRTPDNNGDPRKWPGRGYSHQ